MEALTSSCSKVIVQRLGSFLPRAAAAYVSDRIQFCFSSNEKKGSNFQFLKIEQNKCINPVHAVPSKTQVNLDAVELEAPQTNELAKNIPVKFQLQKKCLFGEQFLIVGDDPEIGLWNPSHALPMTWSDGHIWTAELNIHAGKSIQFKFILKGKEGDITWQPGSDRIIHAWKTMNRVTVCEDWEKPELQKIIDEVQPNIDSHMSTFDDSYPHPEELLIMPNVANVSGIEDGQTHAMKKPLTEQGVQQITADGISSSKKSGKTIKKMIHQNEEFATSHGNDAKIHYLRHNGKAAPVIAKGNKFIEFDGGPIIVPGIKPSVVPTEGTGAGEVEKSA